MLARKSDYALETTSMIEAKQYAAERDPAWRIAGARQCEAIRTYTIQRHALVTTSMIEAKQYAAERDPAWRIAGARQCGAILTYTVLQIRAGTKI